MSDEGRRDLAGFKNEGDFGYIQPSKTPTGSLGTTDDTMRDVFLGLRQWYIENNMEDQFKQAKDWAIKDQKLLPVLQQSFATHDTNLNMVIDESEWVQFAYDVASQASQQGISVPPMDEDIVRRYYYAFNHVSKSHKGVSINKLAASIENFKEYDKSHQKMLNKREALLSRKDKQMKISITLWIILIIVAIVFNCDSYGIRGKLDMKSGYVSSDFQRYAISSTVDRAENCRRNNISYCDDNALQWSRCEADAYWNEEGMVVISQSAENKLMEASYELHNMALEAVDLIVNNDTLLDLFYVNRDLWPAIKESWNKSQTDFQGRFDFVWDGSSYSDPKLLEYNADTPSLQIESSRLHKDWFNSFQRHNTSELSIPRKHQSNYFEDRAGDFQEFIDKHCDGTASIKKIALLSNSLDDENMAVMLFFNSIFSRYYSSLDLVDINDLDFKYQRVLKNETSFLINTWKNSRTGLNYDCLLGLYPKEWMISEQPNYAMKQYDWKNLKSFEPFWKLLLGNKALLPLLWSMYPNHKNLLPAFYDDPKKQLGADRFNSYYATQKWVSKPIFGREGMGVFFSSNFSTYDEFVQRTESNYGYDAQGSKLGKSIYQQEGYLASAQGRIIQTSAWVVGGMPAGLAFREGKAGHHFEDTNPFLVHMVKDSQHFTSSYFTYRTSLNQRNIRRRLYNKETGSQSYHNWGFKSYDQNLVMHSDAFMDWISAGPAHQRSLEYQKVQNQTLLSDTDASYIRYQSLSQYEQTYSVAQPDMNKVNIFKSQNGLGVGSSQIYSMPKKSFGTISGYDMRYQGYWFSVDRHGVIRRHTYSSAGFGRS